MQYTAKYFSTNVCNWPALLSPIYVLIPTNLVNFVVSLHCAGLLQTVFVQFSYALSNYMYITTQCIYILYLLNCSPMLSILVSILVSISVSILVSVLIALTKPTLCSVEHCKIDYLPDHVESNYSLFILLSFSVSTTPCIFVKIFT